MAFPNLKRDRELFKITTKDDEMRELEWKTEKQHYGKVLNSPNTDNDDYETLYQTFN